MPQITITVQNKPYTLSCPAGNEDHVYRLAEKVNTYMNNLVKHGAILSNQGLLIFALLGMAEKIETLEDKVVTLQQELEVAYTLPIPLVVEPSVPDVLMAEILPSPVMPDTLPELISSPTIPLVTEASHSFAIDSSAFSDENLLSMEDALSLSPSEEDIETDFPSYEPSAQEAEDVPSIEQLISPTLNELAKSEAEHAAEAFLTAATLSLEQWQSNVTEALTSDNLSHLKKRADSVDPFLALTAQVEADMQAIAQEQKEKEVTYHPSEHLEMAADSGRLLNEVLERIALLSQKLETTNV